MASVDTGLTYSLVTCNTSARPCQVAQQSYNAITFNDAFESFYAMKVADAPSSNTGNPFVMSVSDGATVSGLILVVWATAYAFRALARSLLDKDTD